MSNLEKFGLFLMLIGFSVFREPAVQGIDILAILVGFGVFMLGGEFPKGDQ